MKNIVVLILILVTTWACRKESPSEAITKPQLQAKLEELQAVSKGDISAQISRQDDSFKEKVAVQVLAAINEPMLKKLAKEPRFKELLKKLSSHAQENLKLELEEIKNLEEKTFQALKIKVKTKVGLKLNPRLSLADPYLKYQVRSRAPKKLDCAEIDSTHDYFKKLLALRTKDDLLLGAGPELFAQYTKSCLLFLRLRASMEECQSELTEPLNELCKIEKENTKAPLTVDEDEDLLDEE